MWIWIANNLQNFTQKDLTEVKIFQKLFGELLFLKHLVDTCILILTSPLYTLVSVVFPKAQFLTLYSLSCIQPHLVLSSHLCPQITTFMQMT